jgi:predicted RNase H-like HicB family nuclease
MKQRFNPKGPFTLNILVYYERSSRIWCAHCLDFDLVEDGNTPEEAENNLKVTISSYIDEADKKGMTAEQVYKSAPLFFWDLLTKAEVIKVRREPKHFPMGYISHKAPPLNANETTEI